MPRCALLGIVLLGLVLRIGYAVAIYEPSLVVYHGGEYELYRMGAEDVLKGDLGFTSDLYLMRPPLFPLLMAALDLQPFAILMINILFSSAIAPVTFVLARQLRLPIKFALLATIIVALDQTSIKYAGVLQAEPLANLLLALAFVSLLKAWEIPSAANALPWAALTGAFIALSALTRPSAYMLWLPMAFWLGFARRQGRILAASALLVIGFGGAWLWTSHNAAVFGHRTFTTIGNYNLLYYRAASVLHQATGQKIDEVYAELARRVEMKLGKDTANISTKKRYEHYTGSPHLQSAMTEVAIGVFRDHPFHYALTIPVGLFRVLMQTDGPLARISLLWNLALIGAAAFGLWRLIQAKFWTSAVFLALPCAYFVCGTLLVQTSGIDTRARVMITPLLAVMAAYGLMHLLIRRRAASAFPSPPVDS